MKLQTCIHLLIAGWLIFGSISFGVAQDSPGRHMGIRGDMPPGVAADMARLGNRQLENYLQPVQIFAPEQTVIDVVSNDGFISTNSSVVSLGMFIGPVYRIKISNIPLRPGKVLYPSIEVINKLNPPMGSENDFPIQVVLTMNDLRQALDGNFVSKVIYLEDPQNAVPQKHVENRQPEIDVNQGVDPLKAARQLGRPMAIVRIGSRIPTATDLANFTFGAPDAQILPAPNPGQFNPQYIEPVEFKPLQLPKKLRNDSNRSASLPPKQADRK
ncbi:MAG: hypothetical protein AAF939_14785 [Planctomycetota bacterium]